jgi:hypothetical protein
VERLLLGAFLFRGGFQDALAQFVAPPIKFLQPGPGKDSSRFNFADYS